MIAPHPLATLLIYNPAWLQVWFVDMCLHVYVSKNVWLHCDVDYAPVRDMLPALGAVLVSEELVKDISMMGAKARHLVYAVERTPDTEALVA